jgi:hypothetical protein
VDLVKPSVTGLAEMDLPGFAYATKSGSSRKRRPISQHIAATK